MDADHQTWHLGWFYSNCSLFDSMTDLSSVAQSVLIAEAKSRCLREERGCHPDDSDWNGCWVCVHRRGLAAALRAAVDHVVPDKGPPIEDFNEFDQGYAVAHIAHRADFLAIITELESANG